MKYIYSQKAEIISRIAGITETVLVAAAIFFALYKVWIFTIILVIAAILMWYFTRRYCSKTDGAALAFKIKNDAEFAKRFFEDNPQLEKWYCPNCRSVLIGSKCDNCGWSKPNLGNKRKHN